MPQKDCQLSDQRVLLADAGDEANDITGEHADVRSIIAPI
jgi:hypothetical protein